MEENSIEKFIERQLDEKNTDRSEKKSIYKTFLLNSDKFNNEKHLIKKT